MPAQGPATNGPQVQAWEMAADGWYRNAALINTWLKDVTAAMLDAACIGPGARVLDVAAGAGGQTLDIARRVGDGGHVLATDIAPQVAARARESTLAAGLHNVEIQVADAQNLAVAGAGFDAAVCRLGLMFCASPATAVAQMHHALKPGGHLAAVVFSAPQANPCVAVLMATARRHAGLGPASPSEPGTLFSLGRPGLMAQLLREAGFEKVQVDAVAAPMRLPSSRAYIEFIRTSGSPIMAILAPLSNEQQALAWADMAQQLEQFVDPQGWCGPNELLLCSARRPAAT